MWVLLLVVMGVSGLSTQDMALDVSSVLACSNLPIIAWTYVYCCQEYHDLVRFLAFFSQKSSERSWCRAVLTTFLTSRTRALSKHLVGMLANLQIQPSSSDWKVFTQSLEPTVLMVILDGRNCTIVAAESLARVITVIWITSAHWRRCLHPKRPDKHRARKIVKCEPTFGREVMQ